jgi:N-methylhydantoinase A
VDVGGTFTDLIFVDDATGEVVVGKGLSSPASPDEGVMRVVTATLTKSALASAKYFLHGTTVGINALLEHKGARVGLLTTRGFRDVLELRRGDREAMYDILWQPPPPLVPRRLRLPITERTRADGTKEAPVDEADVKAAAEAFVRDNVESVAIVFINSYVNSENELTAERLLRLHGFKGDISLSHKISGEYREYERTSTTVVDAYVRPHVASYLQRLEGRLVAGGFGGECLLTGSGGGMMTFREGEQRPFEAIMSGPVAGAIGAAELCRDLGIEQAITADVGGTSFDTCLITKGRAHIKYEGQVAGMPLQAPWVDVKSIGAGGGSIAYVDRGGLLRVGPESAGANPGPVCYGLGGDRPTVTDAAATLGMLAFGELAGGVTLALDIARAAVGKLGEQLRLDADRTAQGIIRIINAAMADAIRSVTVEQGQDPRSATIIAFGGAGPLFGTLLARELDISTFVVPQYAGNFSAWGLLGQDVARSASRTSINRVDRMGTRAVNKVLKTLFDGLGDRASLRTGNGEDAGVREAYLDLRYVGQEYTLTIRPLVDQDGLVTETPEQVRSTFEEDYARTFGHTLPEPVEVVSARALIRKPLPRRSSGHHTESVSLPSSDDRTVDAYSFTRDARIPFQVRLRTSLRADEAVQGPLILLEETATTYVDADFELQLASSGVLLISDRFTGSKFT